MENVRGAQFMYKINGRSGQFVYIRVRGSSDEWGGIYQEVHDCKNWEFKPENLPWRPIVPGSVDDEIAKDVCNR